MVKIRCFAAGQLRDIPVKVLGPVDGRTAGADLPLLLVVIKPLGYRLRIGSKLLYRQPALLIGTDVQLDLQLLVQSYTQRWEIECNHREEKSLLGVAQGQVRSPPAVSRLPQLQVASYSLLLLAWLLSSGFQRTADSLPLPKWRRQAARPSLLDLLNLLREQIFARGVDAPVVSFDDFASAATPPDVKSSTPDGCRNGRHARSLRLLRRFTSQNRFSEPANLQRPPACPHAGGALRALDRPEGLS